MRHRSAFTLLETIIAMAITGTILTLVATSLDVGSRFNERVTLQTDLSNRANEVLNRLALELRNARADSASLLLPFSRSGSPTTGQDEYRYFVSTGISATTPFSTTYESSRRSLIYNKSARSLTLVRTNFPTLGTNTSEVLTSDLGTEDAFSIEQIGMTLNMQLRLMTSTRRKGLAVGSEEDIVHVSEAKVLFLRATLDTSSGAAPISAVFSPPIDADGVINVVNTGPTIEFGNLVTLLSTSEQVAIFITAPIGSLVNSGSVSVTVTSGVIPTVITATSSADGLLSGGTAFSLTRATLPATNGTCTLSLTGTIDAPISVTVTASTTGGISASETKNY